ncbi:MAG: CMP-N-acetylneuraminic acid synthetase [Francisellaceae bacterium]|jgi:CMP-N-acetylneuraminic acid synthetase
MKIVSLIPYWSGYSFPENSLDMRDTLRLGGYSLINYTVKAASQVDDIDEVIIYSSNEDVLDLIDKKNKCEFVKRDIDLDANDVSIEDIIERFMTVSDADIVVLMHPKSPFLRSETLSTCIAGVKNGEYDSAFLVSEVRKLAWFKGKPFNYRREKDTPSLSCLEPVFFESSSVYVFTRELFERTRHRIGDNPLMFSVGHFEGFEVDKEDDYKMAELIINSGFESFGN